MRYYHASLASHPKRVLAAAAKAGYLQGCPGLTAEAINKSIDIEDATEMGQLQQYCKNCTGIVNHIPSDCPELPGNEAIKVEMAERKAKRLARDAARGGRGRR